MHYTIIKNINNFHNFKKVYRFINQINSQVKKKNNHQIFLMEPNKIIGFVINNLIYIEKKSEYEILPIYVDNKCRKFGYASYLINVFTTSSYLKPLRKLLLNF